MKFLFVFTGSLALIGIVLAIILLVIHKKRLCTIVIIVVVAMWWLTGYNYMQVVRVSQRIDYIDKSYGITLKSLREDPVLSGHGFEFVTENELKENDIVCIMPNKRVFIDMFDMSLGCPIGKLVVVAEYKPTATYGDGETLGPITIKIK